jgi:hypothetical protein
MTPSHPSLSRSPLAHTIEYMPETKHVPFPLPFTKNRTKNTTLKRKNKTKTQPTTKKTTPAAFAQRKPLSYYRQIR